MILLVMQTLDNHLRFRPRRRLLGRTRLTTEQDPDNPNPTYIEAANDGARRMARLIDGFPQSSLPEAVANMPTTAHILGGAVMAEDPDDGVIDLQHRVFGYRNLLICDGSAMPANPGVNPSLTITAMAERALTFVEPKDGGARPALARAAGAEAETSATT